MKDVSLIQVNQLFAFSFYIVVGMIKQLFGISDVLEMYADIMIIVKKFNSTDAVNLTIQRAFKAVFALVFNPVVD